MSHSPAPRKDSPLEARYANAFNIGYNRFEFIIEFGQSYEENGTSSMHTRIVTGPAYATVLLQTLRDTIRSYEEVFGDSGTA